jgi:hypothetical protein
LDDHNSLKIVLEAALGVAQRDPIFAEEAFLEIKKLKEESYQISKYERAAHVSHRDRFDRPIAMVSVIIFGFISLAAIGMFLQLIGVDVGGNTCFGRFGAYQC